MLASIVLNDVFSSPESEPGSGILTRVELETFPWTALTRQNEAAHDARHSG